MSFKLPPTGLDLTERTPEDIVIKDLTDDEIKELAMRMFRGEVFTSDMIDPNEFHQVVHMIFMPMIFMGHEHIEQCKAQEVTMFWANMADAGPRSINGYPIFMSCSFVKKQDHQRVIDKYRQIQDTMKAL
jgi:hypothetical protein